MTLRFAFYGRVSTEDQQDPESSKAWQLARSRSLIEPHSGVIVVEFFDIGLSRSLPWKRRPQAAALLDTFRDRTRGFDAVVIGEPARAFYGNQFGLTFPLFVHFDVALWVPEVGGPVDPRSDAHEIVMSLYGGMSKGERNRIKLRVRTAMAAQAAQEGRFLGGRPPYGYRIGDLGPHPNPGKAALGQRLHRLEPDPVAAPIVQRIFTEYLAGRGLFAIAHALTRDAIPCPSAYDPGRNRHRRGIAWSKSALRAILTNPRYTGRQVWNRQRRDEVLIDVHDVGLGHETVMRWNDADQWIWSASQTHEPLVSVDVFEQVLQQMAAGSRRPVQRKPRATERPYLLRGLLRCGICQLRMQGTWTNGDAYYRCRAPRDYAFAEGTHPRNVYLREAIVVDALDGWLAGLFEGPQLEKTVDALASGAAALDPAVIAAVGAAKTAVADCDARLARYRAALEAGADATVVTRWISEVQAERLRAQITLDRHHGQRRMTKAEIDILVRGLGDLLEVLRRADPQDRAEVYRQLGIDLVYHPEHRTVTTEARPAIWAYGRVGGGT